MSKCYGGYPIPKTGPCSKCGAQRGEGCGLAHIKDTDTIKSLTAVRDQQAGEIERLHEKIAEANRVIHSSHVEAMRLREKLFMNSSTTEGNASLYRVTLNKIEMAATCGIEDGDQARPMLSAIREIACTGLDVLSPAREGVCGIPIPPAGIMSWSNSPPPLEKGKPDVEHVIAALRMPDKFSSKDFAKIAVIAANYMEYNNVPHCDVLNKKAI